MTGDGIDRGWLGVDVGAGDGKGVGVGPGLPNRRPNHPAVAPHTSSRSRHQHRNQHCSLSSPKLHTGRGNETVLQASWSSDLRN